MPAENSKIFTENNILAINIGPENLSEPLDGDYFTARDQIDLLPNSQRYSIIDDYLADLSDLEHKLQMGAEQVKKRKLKHYYQNQMNLLQQFREDSEYLKDFDHQRPFARSEKSNLSKSDSRIRFWETILTRLTLAVNLLLFASKIVAAILSGSLVVLSSVVDSAMDLTTALVMFCTTRPINKRNLQKYPRGRTRLEPLAIIVISVIMGAANVQIVVQSIESMVRRSMNPHADTITLTIMVSTVVFKVGLFFLSYSFSKHSASIRVLMQGNRNDCLSNTVAVVCAFLASNVWVYLDPVAAILVSLCIIFTWVETGFQHVRILSGRAAGPDIINRIIKVCIDHRPQVLSVDTVYAYHFGIKYLVEAHVVLSKNITLKEAHDISEPLQQKIEQLPFVERAFVHVDYNTSHRPEFEHKIV